MSARYRVALHGFSDFERTTLTFCFRHAETREPGYLQVALIADSDFIVADASHAALAGSQTRGDRMRDTLFIGDKPPYGVTACLPRPIDPERILRALDHMAAQRVERSPDARPDILLPLDAAETRFPLLDHHTTEDTTPAAFQHEPVSITFTDLQAFNELDNEPAALAAAATGNAPVAKRRGAAVASDGPAGWVATTPRAPVASAKPSRLVRLSDAERVAAKAAARRASRLRRLEHTAEAGCDVPHDVLLLNAEAGPVALGVLLEAFGFVVHRAHNMAEAATVLARTPLAAAFVDVDAGDANSIDGLELCQLVKQRQLPLAGSVPAVMLTCRRDSAAGRVRAKLAGCDAFLAGTVTRGDAARALESCNVALPADARRA